MTRRLKLVKSWGYLPYFILLLKHTIWLFDRGCHMRAQTYKNKHHWYTFVQYYTSLRRNRKITLQLLFILSYELAVRWCPQSPPLSLKLIFKLKPRGFTKKQAAQPSLRSSFSPTHSWCLLFDFSTLFPPLLLCCCWMQQRVSGVAALVRILPKGDRGGVGYTTLSPFLLQQS